jgi:hypothetical protein
LTRRALWAAAAASLLLAACGGGNGHSVPPPQGPPTLRHPAADVDAAQAGEDMRAQLVAASSLYGVGQLVDSQAHMDLAKAGYTRLTDLVRPRDADLDREISAAFGVIAGQIAQKQTAPAVENRMGLIQGQLLNAAITDAVSLSARNDPTVAAQVLVNLSTAGLRSYTSAARQPGTVQGRREFQNAFGLLTRALAVGRGIGLSLGPERVAALNALGAAHNDGFPLGVVVPKELQVAKVTADVAKVKAAVAKRFRVD